MNSSINCWLIRQLWSSTEIGWYQTLISFGFVFVCQLPERKHVGYEGTHIYCDRLLFVNDWCIYMQILSVLISALKRVHTCVSSIPTSIVCGHYRMILPWPVKLHSRDSRNCLSLIATHRTWDESFQMPFQHVSKQNCLAWSDFTLSIDQHIQSCQFASSWLPSFFHELLPVWSVCIVNLTQNISQGNQSIGFLISCQIGHHLLTCLFPFECVHCTDPDRHHLTHMDSSVFTSLQSGKCLFFFRLSVFYLFLHIFRFWY